MSNFSENEIRALLNNAATIEEGARRYQSLMLTPIKGDMQFRFVITPFVNSATDFVIRLFGTEIGAFFDLGDIDDQYFSPRGRYKFRRKLVNDLWSNPILEWTFNDDGKIQGNRFAKAMFRNAVGYESAIQATHLLAIAEAFFDSHHM